MNLDLTASMNVPQLALLATVAVVLGTFVYVWLDLGYFVLHHMAAAWAVLAGNGLAAFIVYRLALGRGPFWFMFWGILGNAFRMLCLLVVTIVVESYFGLAEAGIFSGCMLVGFFIYLKFEIWTLHTCSVKQCAN